MGLVNVEINNLVATASFKCPRLDIGKLIPAVKGAGMKAFATQVKAVADTAKSLLCEVLLSTIH